MTKAQIMKRAWKIFRTLVGDRIAKLSMALRQAWAEAKAETVPATASMKRQIINRLKEIVANSTVLSYCEMKIKVNDWQNYGKSRTYFSIVERSIGASKHYKEKKYGYVDNITGEYFPAKYGDAMENYTFGGMRF